jgi:putative nucleotidyltransferase with HDIG domain
MVDESAARELARGLLSEAMPWRWAHVQGVARQAQRAAAGLGAPGTLIAAAWLHDVGYAPTVKDTGFHPLDGARYLRRMGVDEEVVRLVAHHTCALAEAAERGLDRTLAGEFGPADPVLTDALCFADMTTSPDGELVDASDRLAEIQARYGPDDVVTRFIGQARPEILAAVERTKERLAAAGRQPM